MRYSIFSAISSGVLSFRSRQAFACLRDGPMFVFPVITAFPVAKNSGSLLGSLYLLNSSSFPGCTWNEALFRRAFSSFFDRNPRSMDTSSMLKGRLLSIALLFGPVLAILIECPLFCSFFIAL